MKVKERIILAREFHPNLLGGLIPVSQPAFIDKEGNARPCLSVHLEYDNKDYIELSEFVRL